MGIDGRQSHKVQSHTTCYPMLNHRYLVKSRKGLEAEDFHLLKSPRVNRESLKPVEWYSQSC